jgi:hypothetical protein
VWELLQEVEAEMTGKRYGGSKARAMRARCRAIIVAHGGAAPCRRCGRPVTLAAYDAGHIDDRYAGGADDPANAWPEHPRCNRSAGGKVGAAITNAKRAPVVARMDNERSRGIRGW